MNTRLQDKIDQYHAGRMNSNEIDSFEKEIASDPSLQSESDFQGDIINGLKDFRRMELKARLSSIDVSPVWYDFVQQSTLLKSFGGVAVATIIGSGVFFLAEPKEEELGEVIVDSPKELLKEYNWNIQPAELTSEQFEESLSDKAEALAYSAPVLEEEEEEDLLIAEVVADEETENFAPNFDAPLAEEIVDEEAMEVSTLDELPENASVSKENEPIDVDYESKKSLDIKYKYYDGKLFLTGDFDRAPYEILEINSAEGRRIYVKYLDKFYKVNVTDRLTPLPQVYNVEIIKELKLLRENK